MLKTLRSVKLSRRVRACSPLRFELVQRHIKRLELDDRQLEPAQFLTICGITGLQAFGRVRQYEGFAELCSLGVVQHQRGKGLGQRITRALIGKSQGPVYLVSVIPQYFEPLGFQRCLNYPPQIAEKLSYCESSLAVAEKYVVMRLQGS